MNYEELKIHQNNRYVSMDGIVTISQHGYMDMFPWTEKYVRTSGWTSRATLRRWFRCQENSYIKLKTPCLRAFLRVVFWICSHWWLRHVQPSLSYTQWGYRTAIFWIIASCKIHFFLHSRNKPLFATSAPRCPLSQAFQQPSTMRPTWLYAPDNGQRGR